MAVVEVRQEEERESVPIPSSPHTIARERGIEAERAVARWLIATGYAVASASTRDGCDLLITKGADVRRVHIFSGRAETLPRRIRSVTTGAHGAAGKDVIVFVGENAQEAASSERLARKLAGSTEFYVGMIDDGRLLILTGS